METVKQTPLDFSTVKNAIQNSGIKELGKATIRELVRLVNIIEKQTGEKFIRMEMGVPGLEPHEIGIQAEIEALKRGVASKYPMIEGVEELKNEFSRFVKLFMNIDIRPECCIPTVGSMQGGFAAFLIMSKIFKDRKTTLFIDPGFPVQKQQHQVLGIPYETFDVYNYRGDRLRGKLEEYLSKGHISSIVYSNPNNPSWICFTEKELQIIGELANQYNVVVIEDLAYFAMDFRKDLSKPGIPPYQPTVANYTDNYILLISSSKAFSYAGQRIAMLAVSNKLFDSSYPDMIPVFNTDKFGYALIYKVIYSLSAGVSHSAQHGMAAILKAVNDGKYNFVEHVKDYAVKAQKMKKAFTDNGFYIVYDKDENEPLADGFYFTFAYPGMTAEQLLEELLFYGISAISLTITGSERKDGLRACVSQVKHEQIPVLEERLKIFHQQHCS